MKSIRQILNVKANNIKPLTKAPITIDFFNGVEYEGRDKVNYPGYTPVVVGSISTNPDDVNYLSQEDFDKLAIDAYYDIDAYVNKAMTVFGMFEDVPSFSNIPVITKDHMMRAIAAKLEQNLFTKPSNAEIRVTLTQSSGGRTTNEPARENFNPSDLLNHKVQEYINGSRIFELIKDNLEALILERNDYYTKEEIDILLKTETLPIEQLYTKDPLTWEPTDMGDGVNKKYVDKQDGDLQSQINALIVGDVELKTNHVQLVDQGAESLSGWAVEQADANIEFTTRIKKNTDDIRIVGLRQGVPFQGYKTLEQTVKTLEQIVDFDDVSKGTYDGLSEFDAAKGEYTIGSALEGNLIAIEATAKIVGEMKPGIKAGTFYMYKNGALFIDPVSNLPVKQDFIIDNINGAQVTVRATDFAVRVAGTGGGEVEIGDVFSLWAEGVGEVSISDISFDLVNLKQINQESTLLNSSNVSVDADESISGLAVSQEEVNKGNVDAFNNVQDQLDSLESQVSQDTMIIKDNDEAIINDYKIFKGIIVKQFDDTSKVEITQESDATLVDRKKEGQGNLYFEFFVDYVDEVSGNLVVETYNYDSDKTTNTIVIPYTFDENEDGTYNGNIISGTIKTKFSVGRTAFRYKPQSGQVKIVKTEIDEYVGKDAIAFSDGVKVEDVKWGDKVDKEVVGTDGSKGEIFNRKFSTGDSVVWMAVQRPVGDVDTVGTNRVEMRIQDNYGASDAVQALIRAADADNKAMPYVPVTGASIVTKDYVDTARAETHKALMQEIEILRAEIRNLKR